MDSPGKRIAKIRRDRNMTQDQLARKADIPYTTLTKLERGAIKNPSSGLISKIAQSLKLSTDTLLMPKSYSGSGSLQKIWHDCLESMVTPGDFMCISGIQEGQYLHRDKKGVLLFVKQLKARQLSQRLLTCEGDTNFLPGEHIEYRSIEEKYFNPTPMYVYADRVAFLLWDPEEALIIQNATLADAFRRQFLFVWEHAHRVGRR
jgi:transcriptional regulator with XRE-family HTH domain